MSFKPSGSAPLLPRGALPLVVLLPLLGVVLARTAALHLEQGPAVDRRVDRMMRTVTQVAADRGAITDREGRALAATRVSYGISFDGTGRELWTSVEKKTKVRDPITWFLTAVSKLLCLEPAADARMIEGLAQALVGERRFFVLAPAVSAEHANRLRAFLDAYGWQKWFRFEPIERRVYPLGQVASTVVGYLNDEPLPACGLELHFDQLLRGELGSHVSHHVPHVVGAVVAPGRSVPARGGKSLRLTLDATMAFIAQEELAAACEKCDAEWGCAIVMDPQTGALRAMESWPSFDPEKFSSYATDPRQPFLNRAIHSLFTPGSIFKPFILAGVLDHQLASLDEMVDCGPGRRTFGRYPIRDHKRLGIISVADALRKSSNIGMAIVGSRLGRERMLQTLDRFDLRAKTGIELGGELNFNRPEWNDRYSPFALSFGHEIQVTPLRIAASFAAFANGGKVVTPHLVSAIIDAEGHAVPRPAPEPKQVITPELAETLRGLLEGVVEEGTGVGLKKLVPDLSLAGKSGTTQHEVNKNHYIASFVGFAPAQQAELLCLVVVSGPKGFPHSGSYISGPPAALILDRTIRHLNDRSRAAGTARF